MSDGGSTGIVLMIVEFPVLWGSSGSTSRSPGRHFEAGRGDLSIAWWSPAAIDSEPAADHGHLDGWNAFP